MSKGREYKSELQKYCMECGNVIARHAEICPRCGAEQHIINRHETVIINSSQNDKSRVVYGILGLIFGGWGIHKFYIGRWKIALLYLVFAWTFIPSIIGFIEGVIALMEDDRAFQKRLSA